MRFNNTKPNPRTDQIHITTLIPHVLMFYNIMAQSKVTPFLLPADAVEIDRGGGTRRE